MAEAAGHMIDRTPQYLEFMDKLKTYHQNRGTNLDPEPKVGAYHLDLYKTFNHVVSAGGYDKVSAEKLAWRRVTEELGLASQNASNIASVAFSLKERFYKNLAAFEISTVHGKEPPPKEILEDVTAKGADLLTRTLENFRGKRDSNIAADSAASGDDTPVRERPGDVPGSSLRASRGLREAPPQRVLFQPETGPTRPTRHSSGHGSHTNSPSVHTHIQASVPPHAHHGPPTPTVHAQPRSTRGVSISFAPAGSEMSTTVSSYDPALPVAMALRPVNTPANNPAEFAKKKPRPGDPAARAAILPGVGFDGPNIYLRCLNALRSNLPDEERFALHHLVKISYERGDKYKFESFPGLAEGLVEVALRVGSLFYDVKWSVSCDYDIDPTNINLLDANRGTADILERIRSLQPKLVLDSIVPEHFESEIGRVIEAMLTIRNMVILQDNAVFLSEFYPVMDLLCIVLHLPERESVVELKHYALDIVEHLTPHLELEASDPLYQTLLNQLGSNDRGKILTALRALARISLNLEATNKLDEVPNDALENINNWLLLNDDELTDACLDFLYQYTAVPTNVNHLLKSINSEGLVVHLVRLLSHGGKRIRQEIVLEPAKRLPSKDEVAAMPRDLLPKLLELKEPNRVHQWVKCFFEDDRESFVTQIAAWQAYQNAFVPALKGTNESLISPADFIRNSTSVYKDSNAQVLREPGEAQKFIIHGIRTRARPVSFSGKEFVPCEWTSETRPGQACGQFFLQKEDMQRHVLSTHLKFQQSEENKILNTEVPGFRCQWAGCGRFSNRQSVRPYEAMSHIATHLSALFLLDSRAKRPQRPWLVPATTMTLTYEETLTNRDDRHAGAPSQPAGIPLSAVLILRNIARNVVKTESQDELLKQHELGGEGGGWNERLFRPVLQRLLTVMAENKILVRFRF